MDDEKREIEALKLSKLFKKYSQFYTLPQGIDLLDITKDVLKSSVVKTKCKTSIQKNNRRIYLFTYPSDGLQIKGLISFVPNAIQYPTLVLLRGGNKHFGILNPGSVFFCTDHYTVISTTYRDGVSEGHDEFGGKDVNDVKNLIDYIPQLEERLNIKVNIDKIFMLGASRGGMQLFLTLARYPELQKRLKKIASLSGLLDMQKCIENRIDMKTMFIEDFGLIEGVNGNEKEWVHLRDPIKASEKITKSLPILIVQGSEDNRVDLEEGYRMVAKLKKRGHQVSYLEIEGGDHCIANQDYCIKPIWKWFES